jgi:hypothetical protein
MQYPRLGNTVLPAQPERYSGLAARAGAVCGSLDSTKDNPFRDGGATMTQAAVAVTDIPRVSTCPRCGDERAQWYSDRALYRLLRRDHPVEAYCVLCQEYWQLESHERGTLAAKVTN